jgi:UDP-N-acetylglucosamine 2-epimerase (non-hydrolysing)
LLVLRENTERPEALLTEHARIVGTREADIVAAVAGLLDDRATLFAPREPSTVYGDGQAARRIADAVARRWTGSDRRANAWVDTVGNPETIAVNSDQGSGSLSRVDQSVLGSRG